MAPFFLDRQLAENHHTTGWWDWACMNLAALCNYVELKIARGDAIQAHKLKIF